MQRLFIKRLWLLMACSMGLMLVIVREFIVRSLTPRGFAMAILTVAVALGISVRILIKKSAKETIEPLTGKQRRWAIWELRGIIAFLVFCLIYGSWENRNGPLLPMLTAVIINLCITAAFARALYQLQKSTK